MKVGYSKRVKNSWMGGWMDVKEVIRIAYNNKKFALSIKFLQTAIVEIAIWQTFIHVQN
jgi:hypothetical protein